MKKKILSFILALTLAMGLSVSAFAADTAKDTKDEKKETSETEKEDKEETSKSAHLLADGYEIMDGVTVQGGQSIVLSQTAGT